MPLLPAGVEVLHVSPDSGRGCFIHFMAAGKIQLTQCFTIQTAVAAAKTTIASSTLILCRCLIVDLPASGFQESDLHLSSKPNQGNVLSW